MTGIKVFKVMLASMLELVDTAEEYGKADISNMPYMLRGEVSYLRSVLEDVDRRMNKEHNGYKETQ